MGLAWLLVDMSPKSQLYDVLLADVLVKLAVRPFIELENPAVGPGFTVI